MPGLVNNPWPSAGSGCAQVAGGTVAAGGAGARGLGNGGRSALHTLKLIYVKLIGKSLQRQTPSLGKSSTQKRDFTAISQRPTLSLTSCGATESPCGCIPRYMISGQAGQGRRGLAMASIRLLHRFQACWHEICGRWWVLEGGLLEGAGGRVRQYREGHAGVSSSQKNPVLLAASSRMLLQVESCLSRLLAPPCRAVLRATSTMCRCWAVSLTVVIWLLSEVVPFF